jgi:hypothetical protein
VDDAELERGFQLGLGLADAGEDDVLGRHPCSKSHPDLALGDDVGAGAERGEDADHRGVGVGLDGVADARIEPGERLGECGIGAAHRARRIDIDGGADLLRDRAEREVLGVELTVAPGEFGGEGRGRHGGQSLVGYLRG